MEQGKDGGGHAGVGGEGTAKVNTRRSVVWTDDTVFKIYVCLKGPPHRPGSRSDRPLTGAAMPRSLAERIVEPRTRHAASADRPVPGETLFVVALASENGSDDN